MAVVHSDVAEHPSLDVGALPVVASEGRYALAQAIQQADRGVFERTAIQALALRGSVKQETLEAVAFVPRKFSEAYVRKLERELVPRHLSTDLGEVRVHVRTLGRLERHQPVAGTRVRLLGSASREGTLGTIALTARRDPVAVCSMHALLGERIGSFGPIAPSDSPHEVEYCAPHCRSMGRVVRAVRERVDALSVALDPSMMATWTALLRPWRY